MKIPFGWQSTIDHEVTWTAVLDIPAPLPEIWEEPEPSPISVTAVSEFAPIADPIRTRTFRLQNTIRGMGYILQSGSRGVA